MIENTSQLLANNLFQLMKQFPKMKLPQASLHGLTRSESELLVILAINLDDENPAMTVSEISNLLQITPAGTTHLLNHLEEASCIERLRHSSDRRVVLIGLTEHGQKIAQNLIVDFQDTMIGLLEFLGEEDSQNLVNLITKVIEFFSD